MSALVALAMLSASCPQGAAFERAEQREAACGFAARPAVRADRSTLARLLEEPEFSRVHDRNADVLAVLWQQLVAWLEALFQTSGAATFARTTPYAVLAVAFAIVLIAALRLRRSPGNRDIARPVSAAATFALDPPPEHLAHARAVLATSPREAIREALLALLSSLERRNLVRPDRVKTNREVCAELPKRGADPALVREVTGRVDWYDRAFYSLQPVAADEAAAFIASVEALV